MRDAYSKTVRCPELLTCPSGRDVWWNVSPLGATRIIKKGMNPENVTHLDAYIVYRADNGCMDCISAILECPDDPQLQMFVRLLHE